MGGASHQREIDPLLAFQLVLAYPRLMVSSSHSAQGLYRLWDRRLGREGKKYLGPLTRKIVWIKVNIFSKCQKNFEEHKIFSVAFIFLHPVSIFAKCRSRTISPPPSVEPVNQKLNKYYWKWQNAEKKSCILHF